MRLRTIILTLLLTMSATAIFPQSIDKLREDIRRAEEEIRITNNLLKKTQKDKNASQNQLKLIQSRIRNRRNIIASLTKQMNLIGREVEDKNKTVLQLEDDLRKLKKEYGEMIYASYKNYKLNNYMVFLFAARNFNDATMRVEYMKRYNRMQEEKAARIDSLKANLSSQIADLDTRRKELDGVKESKNREVNSLSKDETQYKKSVTALRSKEGKLSRDLQAKRGRINKLQQQIQRIIAEEARKNRAASKTAVQEKYDMELSGKFDQNQGKLPYPVSEGVIVDTYGIHPHPTVKGLMVNNKGVNIAGGRGASVRSVFEGEVSRIFFFQGLNNSVMVRHGNYITVYSNLATVSVKKGDKVSLGQELGRLSSGDDSEEHVLHFEIWKETTNLNPGSWLRR